MDSTVRDSENKFNYDEWELESRPRVFQRAMDGVLRYPGLSPQRMAQKASFSFFE